MTKTDRGWPKHGMTGETDPRRWQYLDLANLADLTIAPAPNLTLFPGFGPAAAKPFDNRSRVIK
jgi:hypothetical protein